MPADWTLTADGPTPHHRRRPGDAADHRRRPVESPATYTLTETDGPAGYTAGAWICTGGDPSPATRVTVAHRRQRHLHDHQHRRSRRTLTLVKIVDQRRTAAPTDATDWTLTAAGPTTDHRRHRRPGSVTDAPVHGRHLRPDRGRARRLHRLRLGLHRRAPSTGADRSPSPSATTPPAPSPTPPMQPHADPGQDGHQRQRRHRRRHRLDPDRRRSDRRSPASPATRAVTDAAVAGRRLRPVRGRRPDRLHRRATGPASAATLDRLDRSPSPSATTSPAPSPTTTSRPTLTLVKVVDNDDTGGTAVADRLDADRRRPDADHRPTGDSGRSPTAAGRRRRLRPCPRPARPATPRRPGRAPAALVDRTRRRHLPNGGDATCTITNTAQPPHLTLVKTVTNDNGGTAVPTDWTLGRRRPDHDHRHRPAAPPSPTHRSPIGDYNLSETGGPTGYTPATGPASTRPRDRQRRSPSRSATTSPAPSTTTTSSAPGTSPSPATRSPARRCSRATRSPTR